MEFIELDFNNLTDEQIDENRKIIREAERLLNERGYLFASELGFPVYSGEPWVTDCKFEVGEVESDGTVILDFKPVSDTMMKLLTLQSKLERKFMDLEWEIERGLE